jgi:hypothetical protein
MIFWHPIGTETRTTHLIRKIADLNVEVARLKQDISLLTGLSVKVASSPGLYLALQGVGDRACKLTMRGVVPSVCSTYRAALSSS